jgi:hypothetical protein
MCDCACKCCCPTTPPGGGGGEDGGGPPRCTRYRLTIDSIDVSAIDDGFLGGNLEVDFTFVVNGQAQHYVNNDLGTGVTNIGITFFVAVPADTSTITLDVAGVEDDLFFDDVLPGFTAVFGQAQNWGVGAQQGSASDSNITYTLNYTITCARSVDVAIQRESLEAYGRAKAQQRGVEVPADTVLVSWALARLRRDGWEVVQATDQQYMVKGYGTLPLRVARGIPERPER